MVRGSSGGEHPRTETNQQKERTIMKTKEEVTIAKHMEAQRAANDTQLDEDFDDLVLRASEDDRRAVGAIPIALGKPLIEQARIAFKGFDGEAEDVVQDFLLFLLEASESNAPSPSRARPAPTAACDCADATMSESVISPTSPRSILDL